MTDYKQINKDLAKIREAYVATKENAEFNFGVMISVWLPYGKKYREIVSYCKTVADAKEMAKQIKKNYFDGNSYVNVYEVWLPEFKTSAHKVRPANFSRD
jgi:hypothetical protein